VATSAKRGNRRVVAVVMGGQTAASRDQHMAQLLDRSFNQSASTQLASANTRVVPVVAQKTSITTPVPRSVPLLKQTPDPIAMQQTVQPRLSVNEQRVVVMDNNSWEVQIGSYLAHERAQAQAQAATRWIPGAVVITEVEISNRKLYRARLVGLQENQARTACQHLTRQGMECLVVRSQG